MAVLDALPAWATTGIGSLPFTCPREAAAHAVASYDLPFCPQLPRLEGDMTEEWLGTDPHRCGWSPDRDRQRPAAWDALLAQLERHPPDHGLVKLQATGPVTLAHALEHGVGLGPGRAPRVALVTAIASWVAANAAAQAETLAERGLSTLLVVDEPSLEACGSGLPETVWDPLRSAASAWGLHCCSAVPWELVDRAAPDLLSFDLALAEPDRGARDVLARLLARGGRVAWGVLAPHSRELATEACARLPWAAALDPGGHRSLITASCGSGLVPVDREKAIAAGLALTRDALVAAGLGTAASGRPRAALSREGRGAGR